MIVTTTFSNVEFYTIFQKADMKLTKYIQIFKIYRKYDTINTHVTTTQFRKKKYAKYIRILSRGLQLRMTLIILMFLVSPVS